MSSRSPIEELIDLLAQEGVEYLVIGGQAEYLFGSPRVTYDIDLCYKRDAQNLEHLARALKRINPRLRGAPPDLPFALDGRSLALGSNFTFTTDLGPVDLLGWVEPIGAYEQLIERAETYDVVGRRVRTISLDDLIRVKQHIKRLKDQESLVQLLGIREIREQERRERGE